MSDLTIVYSPGYVDAALYEGDKLIDCGHASDVNERLIERLNVTIEHMDFVTDKAALGWGGVSKSLTEVFEHNGHVVAC